MYRFVLLFALLIMAHAITIDVMEAPWTSNAWASDSPGPEDRQEATQKKKKRAAKKRTTKRKAAKKRKPRKSKYEIYAENFKDQVERNGALYFLASKPRISRLLKRLYASEKAKKQDLHQALKRASYGHVGSRSGENINTTMKAAFKIRDLYRLYKDFKIGRISKSAYQQAMRDQLGFVP